MATSTKKKTEYKRPDGKRQHAKWGENAEWGESSKALPPFKDVWAEPEGGWLYALDVNGRVWHYFDWDSWHPVPGRDEDGNAVPRFQRAWHHATGRDALLLALDINGRVWRYDGGGNCWRMLNGWVPECLEP